MTSRDSLDETVNGFIKVRLDYAPRENGKAIAKLKGDIDE